MSTASTNQSTMSSESKHVSCPLSLREPKINHTKKRIGPYSFYLNDCIGNGYSSQVYRGYKNGNKQIMYAIKVIRMGTLSKGRYELLQNQIAILRQLDHPHIIRLHDVFYTQNNCYIITDFCEGGTLQNCIESEVDIDWVIVFNQLLQACSYLEKKLIIHRDLKPANIFFKQNQWKIGDFGFARYIPYKSAEIKQTYQVGSPLFMPPQTLQKNIYSLKTDSFAFGILFYHLITRKFPWSGNSKKQLLQSYSSKPYPIQNINNIGVLFQKFLNRLCQVQISQRLYITDFYYLKGIDSGFSQTTQASLLQIPQEQLTLDFLQELNLDMTQRLKLCRFLFYIDANIQHLSEMVVISQHIRQFLMMLMSLFGQLGNQNWLKQFGICQNYKQLTSIQQLKGFVQSQRHLDKEMPNIKIQTDTIIRNCGLFIIARVLKSENFIAQNYPPYRLSNGNIYRRSNSINLEYTKVLMESNF